MTEGIDELVRGVAASLTISWHTDAPYSIGLVKAERIGFADIPCVVVYVDCKPEDVSAIVPIVRQRVFAELAERGWDNHVVDLKPSVQQNRRRKFLDGNSRSKSFRKAKFGNEHRFTFEIVDREFKTATFAGGRYAKLPDRRSA